MSVGTRRARRIVPRLGIFAAVTLAALTVVALAGAGGSASYADASGDSGSGPDITSVQVTNDDRGNVTFTIALPNRPSPTPELFLLVFLDTDSDANTGDPQAGGADYALASDGGAAGLGKWNGSRHAFSVPASLVTSYAAGTLRISISAADLGTTSGFRFWIGVDDAEDEDNWDAAPDRGMWSYTIATAPLRLTAGQVVLQPARPVSGGAFSASIAVRRSDTGAPLTQATVTCRLMLDGRPLAGASGRVAAGGRATCAARVPRGAAGKLLRGTVTVRSGTASVTKTFSVRIAR